MKKRIILLTVIIILQILQILLTHFLLKIPEEIAYESLCHIYPLFESFHQSVATFIILITIVFTGIIVLFVTVCIILNIKEMSNEQRKSERD